MKAILYILAALGLTGLAYWLYMRFGSIHSSQTNSIDANAQANTAQLIPRNPTISYVAMPSIHLNIPPVTPPQLGYVSPPTLGMHITIPLETVMNTPTLANTFIAGLKKTAWPKNVKSNLKTAKTFSDGYYYTIPSGYDYSGFIVKMLLPSSVGSYSFYAVYVFDKSWNQKLVGNYQTMSGGNGNITDLPATQWIKY